MARKLQLHGSFPTTPGPQGPKGDTGDTGPQGPKGITPKFSVGTVTPLDPGAAPTIDITGTDEAPILNFGIPTPSEDSGENANCRPARLMDDTYNVLGINHRGFSADAPENTIPAYIMSKEKGFNYVECDVSFTSDGVAVLLHDATIDRTSNGSGSISAMTYSEASQYDYGSWKSEEYAGTRIPTFEEFIILCKRIGLHPYIELKSNGAYTEHQIRSLVETVYKCGMSGRVTWISFSAAYLGYVRAADSWARLGYVVESVNDAIIATAKSLLTGFNDVFLDSCTYNADTVSRCQTEGFPLEVWTINNEDIIMGLDHYITGVTSDSLIAGKVLHDAGMVYDYDIIQTQTIWTSDILQLDVSKLISAGSILSSPYYTSRNDRVLYAPFDIDVTDEYRYKIEFEAKTATRIGVTMWSSEMNDGTKSAMEYVANNETVPDVTLAVDPGWQESGFEFDLVSYTSHTAAYIRVVFSTADNATIGTDDIISITITRSKL